jgi:hypothetical protein
MFMKKIISIICVLLGALALFSSTAFAHISNEKNIYDDIQYSKVQEQIVILRTLGALAAPAGVNLFKSQAKLTRSELAYYIATFDNLADDTAKEADFQEAAVQKKLIISLGGNATYQDVNNAFFGGKAPMTNGSNELTHEDYVNYLGQFLTKKVDGKTLYDLAGATPGPAGVINDAKIIKDVKEDQYFITINGSNYKMHPHSKVLYGPVDLMSWIGKKVDKSVFVTHDGQKVIALIVSTKGQFADNEVNASHASMETHSMSSKDSKKGSSPVPIIAGVIALILLGWLFVSWRKKSKS